MIKIILACFIIILMSSSILAQNTQLCTERLIEKYPAMDKTRAENKCKSAISKINISLFQKYYFDDTLLFLEEEKKQELLKLKKRDIRTILAIPEISKLSQIDTGSIKYFPKLSRAEIKLVLNNQDIEIDKLIADKQEFRSSTLAKRKINLDTKEISRKNYLLAKQNFEQAKKNYMISRDEFKKNKEKLISCTIDCDNIQNNLHTNSQNFLKEYILMLESLLSKLISQAESEENLDEKDAKDMLEELKTHLSKVKEMNAKIESASTKNEVKKIGKEISEVWVKVKPAIKRSSGIIIETKIGESIIKAQRLEEKLNLILSNLNHIGVDLKIDGMTNEFSQNIFEAQKLYISSKEQYSKAKYAYNYDELLIMADSEILKANNHIKAAHKLLNNILVNIKNNNLAITEFEKSDEELEITEAAYYAIE